MRYGVPRVIINAVDRRTDARYGQSDRRPSPNEYRATSRQPHPLGAITMRTDNGYQDTCPMHAVNTRQPASIHSSAEWVLVVIVMTISWASQLLARARQPPSSRSSNPWTSFTAPLRSRLATSHSPSALIASRRSRLCRSSSPSRTCSRSRSNGWCVPDAGAEAGFGAGTVLVGSGPTCVGALAGESVRRNVSTSGFRMSRTLSSSLRICDMVLSSVRGAFWVWAVDAFDEGALMGSPPPTRAMVLPRLIP